MASDIPAAASDTLDGDALMELAGMQESHHDENAEPAVVYSDDHKYETGFTHGEMMTCIKVLTCLNERAKVCTNKEYDEVRKNVMRMMVHYEKGRYAGLSRHEYRKLKEEKQERKSKEARLKHYDRLHINTSKLRSDRIDTLNRLIEPQLPFLRANLGITVADTPKLLTAPQPHARTADVNALMLPSPSPVSDAPSSSLLSSSPSPAPSTPSASPSPPPPPVVVVSGVTSVTADREAARRKEELKEVARLRRKKGTRTQLPVPAAPTTTSSTPSQPSPNNDSVKEAEEQEEEDDDDSVGGRYHGKGKRRGAAKKAHKTPADISAAAAAPPQPSPSPPAATGAGINDTIPPAAGEPVPVTGGLRGRGGEGDPEHVLHFPRSCYVCKKRFNRLHFFYDQLCPECAHLNWRKRNQVADLRGKVILLTGSRVKIGYYSGLKLLRCGAILIATSRFPHDTARRYSLEPDFNEWKDRLHVYGLDLRDLRSVVRFTDQIALKYKRLDAIVNNAAQTVRRPPAYYRHLMPLEMKKTDDLSEAVQSVIKSDPHRDEKEVPAYIRLSQATASLQDIDDVADVKESKRSTAAPSNAASGNSSSSSSTRVTISEVTGDEEEEIENTATKSASAAKKAKDEHKAVSDVITSVMADVSNGGSISAAMSQMVVSPGDEVYDAAQFPVGHYDVTGQQLDLRKVNSWLLLLDQVEPSELLEVFAINALSPFILNSRLKRLMLVDPTSSKYIINVSAMEGKFYRFKGPQHPHTNMAKAALNMMTRTSAQDYAADRIFMNSIDTGWINDENPFEVAREIASTNFQTPIDEEDAMARILDPILDGYNTNNNPWGKFYKDYHETEW